jgi:hypothetical protein
MWITKESKGRHDLIDACDASNQQAFLIGVTTRAIIAHRRTLDRPREISINKDFERNKALGVSWQRNDSTDTFCSLPRRLVSIKRTRM